VQEKVAGNLYFDRLLLDTINKILYMLESVLELDRYPQAPYWAGAQRHLQIT
jgi:hypothetical protein